MPPTVLVLICDLHTTPNVYAPQARQKGSRLLSRAHLDATTCQGLIAKIAIAVRATLLPYHTLAAAHTKATVAMPAITATDRTAAIFGPKIATMGASRYE